jgi:hypothetical protein
VFEIQHPISGLKEDTEIPHGFFRSWLPGWVIGHSKCQVSMVKLISAPAIHTSVRGNSDFAQREKARLKKRSTDHWDKVGRVEAIERAEAKGLPIPTGFLRKAIQKKRSISS